MNINNCGRFVAKFISGLLLSGFLSGTALAQLLDDISLEETRDEVVIKLTLADRVHYLRHFPEKQGQTLDIYFDISPGVSVSTQVDENVKRQSPPSDAIPRFTVTSQLEYGVRELVVEFDREVQYSVSPGKDQRSFLIKVRKMTPEELKQPAKVEQGMELPEVRQRVPAATPEEDQTNEQAATLMDKARDAMRAGSYAGAIESFNQLLKLPSNMYTQDAQEWVGVAREHIGQPARARLEYEQYLKLYADTPGADRVKKRLDRLPARTAEAVQPGVPGKKKATETSGYGSLSMYYYYGQSSNDTTIVTNNPVNPLTESAFTAVDQSSLITNLDATERFRSEEFDNRLVFRDSFIQNNLAGQSSRNKLYNAYFEMKNRMDDYSGRIGRQSATGGGVMGRFDGLSFGHGFMSNLRGNLVAGRLADTTSTVPTTQPIFYGVSMDMVGSSEGGWSGSLYAINQTLEGIADRRAVGTEIRYFETRKTVFSLLDYDTLYKTVNTALVQGTLTSEAGTTYNFLVDHRKTPSLSTNNAVYGEPTSPSLSTMMLTNSESALRDLARARTATANLVQFGVAHPFNDKWQIGGDIKMSNVSATQQTVALDGVTIVPATTGTGNEWTFTGQLIGSNIFFRTRHFGHRF